jgi:protein-L-isoaspartate(D-aspartate) O-methyltransferase
MDKIDMAFKKISRADFLLDNKKFLADVDAPISIGFGQTNSQPYTVKNMLTWLDVHKGDKVLDVGSGSGWTTALLSELVGPQGHIYSLEIIPELLEFGRNNCSKYGIKNAKFIQAKKGVVGYSEKSPYDRILVSASATSLPDKLVDQLKPGGKMVIPVGNKIIELTKENDNQYTQVYHPGYIFVPLV